VNLVDFHPILRKIKGYLENIKINIFAERIMLFYYFDFSILSGEETILCQP